MTLNRRRSGRLNFWTDSLRNLVQRYIVAESVAGGSRHLPWRVALRLPVGNVRQMAMARLFVSFSARVRLLAHSPPPVRSPARNPPVPRGAPRPKPVLSLTRCVLPPTGHDGAAGAVPDPRLVRAGGCGAVRFHIFQYDIYQMIESRARTGGLVSIIGRGGPADDFRFSRGTVRGGKIPVATGMPIRFPGATDGRSERHGTYETAPPLRRCLPTTRCRHGLRHTGIFTPGMMHAQPMAERHPLRLACRCPAQRLI